MFCHFPDVEAEVLLVASEASLTYPVSLWPCAPLRHSLLTLLQPPSFSSDEPGKVHLTVLAPVLFLPGMLCPRWPPSSFLYVCSTVTFYGLRGLQPLKITLLPIFLSLFYFFPHSTYHLLTYYIINLLSMYFVCLLMRMLAPNIWGFFVCVFLFRFLSSA